MKAKPVKTKGVKLYFSKKENDIMIDWDEGCRTDALYVLDEFNLKRGAFAKDLISRGYDISTIKFSISKK